MTHRFCLLSSLIIACSATASAADAYPARAIRVVVPIAPSGSSDTATRLIGPRLTEQLGEQVVLDNRSGDNGAIGTQIVARALPGSHTIGLCYTATLATNPAISGDVGDDPNQQSGGFCALHPGRMCAVARCGQTDGVQGKVMPLFCLRYSAMVMPASLMTLAHFSMSVFMMAAVSAPVRINGSSANCANLPFMSALPTTLTDS